MDVSSFQAKLLAMMKTEMEDSGGIINLMLMRSDEDGEPNWRGIIILYVMPLLTCFSLCFIKCCKKRMPKFAPHNNQLEDEILEEDKEEDKKDK